MDDKTIIEPLDKTILQSFTTPIQKNRVVKGWLTVWSGIWKGRDFSLFGERNFVGSEKNCGICIPDIDFPDFSFNIRIRDDQWTIVDLDSDTGVIVNDESVFRKELNDEDWIKAGNTLFRIKKK